MIASCLFSGFVCRSEKEFFSILLSDNTGSVRKTGNPFLIHRIEDIISLRYPFKIIRFVIHHVVIEMVYDIASFRMLTECVSNEPMDIHVFSDGSDTDMNPSISYFGFSWRKDLLRLCVPHVSKIAHFILPVAFRDRLPIFHAFISL